MMREVAPRFACCVIRSGGVHGEPSVRLGIYCACMNVCMYVCVYFYIM